MATTSSTGLQSKIQGMREAKAAFQALPEIVRDQLAHATFTTISEIKRLAKARILASPSVRTRALYNSIEFSMNYNNGRGRVGVTTGSTTGLFAAGTGVAGELKRRTIKGIVIGSGASARLIKPSRYAHFLEFGTHKMPAEPFMIPAADNQKSAYLDRCKGAGKMIEQETARVGMSAGGNGLA